MSFRGSALRGAVGRWHGFGIVFLLAARGRDVYGQASNDMQQDAVAPAPFLSPEQGLRMNDKTAAAPHALPQQPARKVWTAPVVSFLAIDETAVNATVGNDGRGPTTGS